MKINRVHPIFLKGYSITGGSVVLDREVAREFLDEELKGMEILRDISKEELVESLFFLTFFDFFII